ncbi:NAD-dependent epimerase/dehydratase family protein [Pseudomonas sp. OHS18]|uniref:NAD-dependent epimerase/dehydratase family protein n=1 Tax=Pseudomonas sp. OHS18 TaxID=3399679 RepID=UPI003A8C7EA0
MNTSCLVTGGSGFIGRHLLVNLSRHGYSPVVLMRRISEFPLLCQRVTELGGNARMLSAVQGDLSQPGLGLDAAAQRQVAGCATLFHLGFSSPGACRRPRPVR